MIAKLREACAWIWTSFIEINHTPLFCLNHSFISAFLYAYLDGLTYAFVVSSNFFFFWRLIVSHENYETERKQASGEEYAKETTEGIIWHIQRWNKATQLDGQSQ